MAEQLVLAEVCAEATGGPQYVVPALSLAYMPFRANFLEPLLAESSLNLLDDK